MAKTTSEKSAKVAGKGSPSKLHDIGSTIRFSVRLSRPREPEYIGPWTLLALPTNVRAELSSPDSTMVEGTINGFPFRAVLESGSSECRSLQLSQAQKEAAGAEIGDTVTVEITRIGEESECRLPPDLRKALEAAPQAQAAWTQITPMARRDWVLSIISVKQDETRNRRIEITCDKLASGMRRPCCFPGINWRRKDTDVTSDETWIPLPGSKSRTSARSAD